MKPLVFTLRFPYINPYSKEGDPIPWAIRTLVVDTSPLYASHPKLQGTDEETLPFLMQYFGMAFAMTHAHVTGKSLANPNALRPIGNIVSLQEGENSLFWAAFQPPPKPVPPEQVDAFMESVVQGAMKGLDLNYTVFKLDPFGEKDPWVAFFKDNHPTLETNPVLKVHNSGLKADDFQTMQEILDKNTQQLTNNQTLFKVKQALGKDQLDEALVLFPSLLESSKIDALKPYLASWIKEGRKDIFERFSEHLDPSQMKVCFNSQDPSLRFETLPLPIYMAFTGNTSLTSYLVNNDVSLMGDVKPYFFNSPDELEGVASRLKDDHPIFTAISQEHFAWVSHALSCLPEEEQQRIKKDIEGMAETFSPTLEAEEMTPNAIEFAQKLQRTIPYLDKTKLEQTLPLASKADHGRHPKL